jgi:TatD DNase family protein
MNHAPLLLPKLSTPLVDSHCHFDFQDFQGKESAFLDQMTANSVGWALNAGVTLERFPALLALAERFPPLYAAVGVHPDTEDEQGAEPDQATLIRLAAHLKVLAIGETGLDYYRLKGDLEWQRQRFRVHIRAALETGKPLIIHTREAADDTLRILKEEGAQTVGGVFHCFTETWDVAQAALELNFYISISGIVTFKKALQVQDVATRVPLDRLLVETDAPYLAPVPHRGKLNHPALVRHVADEVARLRGISCEQLAVATTSNFSRLFKVNLDA